MSERSPSSPAPRAASAARPRSRWPARGWWVAAHGRDEARGHEVADELGDRGAFVAADLDEPGAPERLVDAVVEARGRLDLLVNNAAVYARGTVADLPAQDLDRLLALNLRAAVLLAGAAVRAMGEQDGGVVVNVASEAGLVGVPGQVAYNVTKAALIMLSRSIAVDHAADGIRAVSVCPGHDAHAAGGRGDRGRRRPGGARAHARAEPAAGPAGDAGGDRGGDRLRRVARRAS